MAATNHSDVQRVISKCRESGCLLLVFVYGKSPILEYVQLNTHTHTHINYTILTHYR